LPRKPERLSSLDLVEALQLAHAAPTLHDLGVLSSPAHPAIAEEVARQHRLDPRMLRGILDYLWARTNLARKKSGRFVAAAVAVTCAVCGRSLSSRPSVRRCRQEAIPCEATDRR
jgi:hypothetical protein